MNSFIVPAHSEQACLAATLQSIHTAAQGFSVPYELIVVNDASTGSPAALRPFSGAILRDSPKARGIHRWSVHVLHSRSFYSHRRIRREAFLGRGASQ